MKRYLALASAASLLTLSCQPPQQVTLDVYRLQGSVMVPQQDQSIRPIQQSYNLLGLFMADAQAATGLVPAPAGVEVRLLRIDDQGRPVSSEPLAVAWTDANGRYLLDVSASEMTLPATNLVLEAGNYATGNYLRNFVTEEQLDLTPVTTALVQLMVDRREPLLSVPVTVIQEARQLSLQGTQSIDYTTIDLANALANTLSSLKANATLTSRLDQLLTRVISGRVLAPNGRVAAAPGFRIDQFLMPPAEALTGLQAVSSDVAVTLSRIDNNGNLVGLPLATARTRSDGSYSFVLPAEAQLSSAFVVSVGSGPSLMRAMLSGSAQLDISPLSEMTTRLIINNGTVLSRPKVPITEFSPPEIIAILDAVQRSTAQTALGGANNIAAVLSVIEPVVQSDEMVRNNLSAAGGIPGPTVSQVPPVTSEDFVTLQGTAQAGSLITVEGGTQPVSAVLGAGEVNYSILVPLKRNSPHELRVRSIIGGDASLPTLVTIRTDTLNPRIVTDRIVARNPSSQSFETIITGASQAIEDQGRVTLIITGPKLGNAVQIQTTETGAFEARLAADSGDLLNLEAVDEANNRSEAQIVVGGPGPVVTTVMQETVITRDAPFADRVITVNGAGFDPVLSENRVTFISPYGQASSQARSVSVDRRDLVAPVPDGLASKLSELPVQARVQVTTSGVPSNDNRFFTLFPRLSVLSQARLNGNGRSEHYTLDTVRNHFLMTSQLGAQSAILNFDGNGNVLTRDVAANITHDSIFRDLALDATGNFLISNFDAALAGKNRELPDIRPSYRVSHYEVSGTGTDLRLSRRVAESMDLGAEPGAIAYNRTANQIYVALPNQGRIVKMSFNGNVFGRPETLASGLPTPIRDLQLTADNNFLYVALGSNLSVFRLTLNAQGDVDLLDSNFAKEMGNGNGHLTVDADANVYLTLGTGIERINPRGQRTSLVPVLQGLQPTVGLLWLNNQIYTHQLNQPDLFRIAP